MLLWTLTTTQDLLNEQRNDKEINIYVRKLDEVSGSNENNLKTTRKL